MILKKVIYLFLFAPLLVHAFEFSKGDLAKVERITTLGDSGVFFADSLPNNSYLKRAMLQIYFDCVMSDSSLKSIKKKFRTFYPELADYVSKYSIGLKDTAVAGYLVSLGYEVRNKNYFLLSMQRNPKKYTSMIMKNYISDDDLLSFTVKYSSYIDDSTLLRFLMLHPFQQYVDSIVSLGRVQDASGFVKAVLDSDTVSFNRYSESMDEWIGYIKDKEFLKRISGLASDSVNNIRLIYIKGRNYEDKGNFKSAIELYKKISDYEAVVRIIAKIGEENGRENSDTMLLNLQSDNEIVRYHRGKTLILKGRKKEGEAVLQNLAFDSSLSYYSIRAAVLMGLTENIDERIIAKPDSMLSMLYDLMKSSGYGKYFDNIAFSVCSNDNSARLAFSRLYNAKKEYNLSIYFVQGIPGSGVAFNEKILLMFPTPFLEIFTSASDTYNVDRAVLLALGREESSFNAKAVSSVGAKGIMQLMDFVYDSYYKDKDYFDVRKNIFGGAKHISIYMKQFPDNYAYSIMSYNAGGGNAAKWKRSYIDWELFNETIPFYETRNFVRKVLRSYYIYKFFIKVS